MEEAPGALRPCAFFGVSARVLQGFHTKGCVCSWVCVCVCECACASAWHFKIFGACGSKVWGSAGPEPGLVILGLAESIGLHKLVVVRGFVGLFRRVLQFGRVSGYTMMYDNILS